MSLPTTVEASWLGVIAAVIAVACAFLARRWAGGDKREKAIRKAAKEWRRALAEGDEVGAAHAKERYDYLKAGGQFFLFLLASIMLAGCRTPPARTVIISEHSMFPDPGFTVPDLPEGQRRWLLLTVPTGVELMLPGDFPQIEEESEEP